MKLKNILLKQSMSQKIAVTDGTCALTYEQLYKQSRLNASFIHANIPPRSHVAILLPNSISYVVAYCSSLLADCVIVPIFYKATLEEIVNSINFCDVSLVLTDDTKMSQLITGRLDRNLFIMNVNNQEIIQIGDPQKQPVPHSIKDVVVMLGTSGSTDVPKRVMLSNDNLVANATDIIRSLDYDSDEVFLVILPLTMASGHSSQLIVSLVLGATLYIYTLPFHPKIFFQTIEQNGITTVTVVPSLLKILLNNQATDLPEIKKLRYICFGGAPADDTILDKIRNSVLRDKFVHMYGQTEATTRISHLHLSMDWEKLPSVGLPLNNIEVAIKPEKQNEAIGEILIKGPNVMVGYYKEENLTLRDGWLPTGDLGYIDDDGYIYITGRKKNIIICSGINIYPEEIENVICQNKYVKEAVVYGVKNSQYGEIPVADVVLRNSNTITPAELTAFCENKLSLYKVPTQFFIVREIKQTYNGKIDRRRV